MSTLDINSVKKGLNIKWKRKFKFAQNKYIFTFVCIEILLLILNLRYMNSPFIFLNENQILYIYSTSAQVIAGLYGLTLTAYIFYNDKLDKLIESDPSIYDIVTELKGRYFRQIVLIGIGCLLSICMSLLTLNTINFFTKEIYSFLLNQTMIIVVTEVICIIVFSWNMADPKNKDKANDRLLQQNKFKTTDSEKGSLEDFLTSYNSIEKNILKLSEQLSNNLSLYNYSKYHKNNKGIGMLSALKILLSLEVFDKELIHEINELRKYRNSIVHSEHPSVSKDTVETVSNIEKKVSEIVEKKLESKE